MKPGFTLYVDESGEAGINKIRTEESGGASPYMTLGAALVPNSRATHISEELAAIAVEMAKPSLHCSQLKHAQLVYYARSVSRMQVLLFGVISRKSTLGWYGEVIEGNSARYYNKCAQYLLEKVGRFMSANDIDASRLSVCFEEGNFDYPALRGLISKCRSNPENPETKFLSRVEPMSISAVPKGDQPLLQLGDLVAHALYKCVDKTPRNYNIPEPRYLKELTDCFFSDSRTGRIEGFGIKSVHRLSELQLDPDVCDFIAQMKAVSKNSSRRKLVW